MRRFYKTADGEGVTAAEMRAEGDTPTLGLMDVRRELDLQQSCTDCSPEVITSEDLLNERRRLQEIWSFVIVVQTVSEWSNVSLMRILRDRRGDARTAAARHLAFFLTLSVLGKQPSEVGELFGRDRTTVLRGVNRVKQRAKRSEKFAAEVLDCARCLKRRLVQYAVLG